MNKLSDRELIKETMMLDYSQLVMHNVYMIKENKRLESIIKEVRDILEPLIALEGTMTAKGMSKLLEILDKENYNEEKINTTR